MEGGVNGRPQNRSLVLRDMQLPAPRHTKPMDRERASTLPATRICLLLARAGNAESAGLRGDERAEDHLAGGDAVREYVKWCGCKVFLGTHRPIERCERHRTKPNLRERVLEELRRNGPQTRENLARAVGARGEGLEVQLGLLEKSGIVYPMSLTLVAIRGGPAYDRAARIRACKRRGNEQAKERERLLSEEATEMVGSEPYN